MTFLSRSVQALVFFLLRILYSILSATPQLLVHQNLCMGWRAIYQLLSISVPETYGCQPFPVASDWWVCLPPLPPVGRVDTEWGLAESQIQELRSRSCVYATEALGLFWILITLWTDAFLWGWTRYWHLHSAHSNLSSAWSWSRVRFFLPIKN